MAFAIAAFPAPAAANTDPNAIARQVAKQRRLPVKKKIDHEIVEPDVLRDRLAAIASRDQVQRERGAEGLALARWGMIPLDADYPRLMSDLVTDRIAAYYDVAAKKLTINKRATEDPAWGQMVIAHEVQHALQDQHFDLKKLEDVPGTERDMALARHALVEGDGVALMIEMMLARKQIDVDWSDRQIARELENAMGLPTGDALDRAPLAVREAMLFPYRAGFAFVAELRRDETWKIVDAAFKRPPRSTEQILHVDKYRADEKPAAVTLDVPAALPAYTVAHSTVWGELGFALFLRSHGLTEAAAAQAAAGWGGDRVLTLAAAGNEKPERAIGLARLEWDSEADAIEAHEAAVRALDIAIVGATAEHTETRTRWLALDGTTGFVERRGTTVTLAVGIPARLLAAVQAELAR